MIAAAVVLGASGRLGQPLLPMLSEAFSLVVAVTRRMPAPSPAHVMWHLADLADTASHESARSVVAASVSGTQRVVVLDLVLDRNGVAAMEQSITATTAFVCRMLAELRSDGIEACTVAASSTAVLATRAFQTPYGRAKCAQAQRYMRQPGNQVVLLPTLGHQPTEAAWTFKHAAQVLTTIALTTTGRDETQSILWVPSDLSEVPLQTGQPSTAHRGLWFIHRPDDPHAYRAVARRRLALLPDALRHGLDHHRAPYRLVRSFGRRNGCNVRYLPLSEQRSM
jgi:uncharacterized protein YbjT (DUF2867 family)